MAPLSGGIKKSVHANTYINQLRMTEHSFQHYQSFLLLPPIPGCCMKVSVWSSVCTITL